LAGAVGVISHIDDIQTFIKEYVENLNAKIRGVLHLTKRVLSSRCKIMNKFPYEEYFLSKDFPSIH
jgi:hypothetical protein